mmetsp:Transcript_32930/g.64595  ORF Transcript_32930/g.64595 Transcript_32930/m.64595 type:complete len:207 (+) Transcript_32930:766-1386(+)
MHANHLRLPVGCAGGLLAGGAPVPARRPHGKQRHGCVLELLGRAAVHWAGDGRLLPLPDLPVRAELQSAPVLWPVAVLVYALLRLLCHPGQDDARLAHCVLADASVLAFQSYGAERVAVSAVPTQARRHCTGARGVFRAVPCGSGDPRRRRLCHDGFRVPDRLLPPLLGADAGVSGVPGIPSPGQERWACGGHQRGHGRGRVYCRG